MVFGMTVKEHPFCSWLERHCITLQCLHRMMYNYTYTCISKKYFIIIVHHSVLRVIETISTVIPTQRDFSCWLISQLRTTCDTIWRGNMCQTYLISGDSDYITHTQRWPDTNCLWEIEDSMYISSMGLQYLLVVVIVTNYTILCNMIEEYTCWFDFITHLSPEPSIHTITVFPFILLVL